MQKYIFILFFIISNFTFAQESKDETETYIKKFRKELRSKNINTFFVVKHIQYGGISITNIDEKNYCANDGVNYRMYAFWKDKNDYWLKVFDNCGGFIATKLEDKEAEKFYIENFEKIKLEEVERYKLKQDSISNGKTYSFISMQSHSPLRYFWCYKDSTVFKIVFNKYNLTTNEKSPNLNYTLNNNLSLVKLNIICEKIIDKYVKTENLMRDQ